MKKMARFLSLLSLLTLLGAVFAPSQARAIARKRVPPSPAEPADSQAYPTRMISFGKFLETTFTLPDSATKVDMSVHLPELMLTELEQTTTKLRARAPGIPSGGTQDRFVLNGGITAFEANAFSAGIKIGYGAGVGDLSSGKLAGNEGALKFNVSTLEMDFYILDTVRQEVVASGKGRAVPVGVGLDVSIDFSSIKSAADFVFKSPMAPLFRKAIDQAITQIASSPRTNFYMDWGASVSAVRLDLKKIFFNAGQRDGIALNDVFTVYDNASMRLGEIKVRSVDFERSSATFKDDPKNILLNSARVGDTVKIFFKSVPK